jgi:hypothetical protein
MYLFILPLLGAYLFTNELDVELGVVLYFDYFLFGFEPEFLELAEFSEIVSSFLFLFEFFSVLAVFYFVKDFFEEELDLLFAI